MLLSVFLAILVLVPLQRPALAAVDVSFPLDGYYRPGKYFPVRLALRGEPAGMLRLGARQAVATELPVGGRDQTVIVPVLAISSSLVNLFAFPPSGQTPVHIPNLIALTDDDRLVAIVGDANTANNAAQTLFPDNNILQVKLDTSVPLFEPLAAWQSLDGVILDSASAGRITQGQLAGLLAAGTVVAIIGGDKPGGPWRWVQVGNLWVASRPEAGPDEAVEREAYSPSQGAWKPSFDARLCWQVFVLAAVFSAALLGLLLLRPRGMTLIGIAVAASAAGGAIYWHSRQITAHAFQGSIYIRGGREVLHDQWSYHAVIRPETVTMPFDHLLRPIFWNDHQPAQTQIHLQCDERGNPARFIYRQEPNTTLAFVSRTIEPGFGDLHPSATVPSSMRRMSQLADDVYVHPNDLVVGLVPAPPGDDWPAVVINAPARFDSQ